MFLCIRPKWLAINIWRHLKGGGEHIFLRTCFDGLAVFSPYVRYHFKSLPARIVKVYMYVVRAKVATGIFSASLVPQLDVKNE